VYVKLSYEDTEKPIGPENYRPLFQTKGLNRHFIPGRTEEQTHGKEKDLHIIKG